MRTFEEQYEDVLQNIEAAIVAVHRAHPELLDYDVDAALETLVARYTAEQRGRTAREPALQGVRRAVFGAVLDMCEWRLGRGSLGPVAASGSIGVDAVAGCLKRVHASVRRHTRSGGRQGYLVFIRNFVA